MWGRCMVRCSQADMPPCRTCWSTWRRKRCMRGRRRSPEWRRRSNHSSLRRCKFLCLRTRRCSCPWDRQIRTDCLADRWGKRKFRFDSCRMLRFRSNPRNFCTLGPRCFLGRIPRRSRQSSRRCKSTRRLLSCTSRARSRGWRRLEHRQCSSVRSTRKHMSHTSSLQSRDRRRTCRFQCGR